MVQLSRGSFAGAGSFSGQGFRVEFTRQQPGPLDRLQNDAIVVRSASQEAVFKTTQEIKEKIRDFVDAHFAGSEFQSNNRRKVANASAQSVFYDDIEGKGQYAGLVYSKFGKRDAGGFVDFLLLHVRGGTIRPGPGESWIRIANPKAGATAGSVAQTGKFGLSNSRVFFVKSKDGQKLYQLRRYGGRGGGAGRTELLATLVKSITVQPRLAGIEALARTRAQLFEGHFARALALQDSKAS